MRTIMREFSLFLIFLTSNAFGVPPVADDLSIAVDYGSQLSSSTIATDPGGDALVFEVMIKPVKGYLIFNADGTFTYTPTVFQIDTDSFTFRVSDGQLTSNEAKVSIEITRSAEITAKYDLREKVNAHWADTVIANPGTYVIVGDKIVIDLNNDGDDDIMVTQFLVSPTDEDLYQPLEAVIFRNIGNAYVKESTNLFLDMKDYTVSDFNGDGLQDVYITNEGFDVPPFLGGQDRLLLQNGDGTLSDLTSSNLPDGLTFTAAVCSGDYDSDGDIDLYIAEWNPFISHLIYQNNGVGVFTDATSILLPPEMQADVLYTNFQSCESADFNKDGRDDLVLGQQGIDAPEDQRKDGNDNILLDSLVVLYGSDQGKLVTNYTTGLLPVNWDGPTEYVGVGDIRVADFNQDDCLDVVLSSGINPSIAQSPELVVNKSAYFGDCAGGFSDPFNYTQRKAVETADTLLISDINHDGFPDFVNRYRFDAYIDGGLETTPVSDVDYNPRAYISTQSLTEPFAVRRLSLWDVEQLRIDEFLGLIHNSLHLPNHFSSNLKLNAGLNDAWYNPETDGQGFFITIFPDIEYVSLSWFTYDTERPEEGVTANLGEPGHRWLNALGQYSGNRAVMDISISSGGQFDTSTEVKEVVDGTIILTFNDCTSGKIEYEIPSIGLKGVVPIQRVVGDNIALCKSIAEKAVTQQSRIKQSDDNSHTMSFDAPMAKTEASPLVDMNAGLNDAWYNPDTNGQGFLITVFPDIENVLLSWFTYDTIRPGEDTTANLGEPGHRWLNALGTYSGNKAEMDITIASGGVFNTQTEITEVNGGTVTLTFTDCENGIVEYDIPSINRQGTVPIQRIVGDNIALCEALNAD